jgi:predicted nuclease of restriction endonuclease-like (RecB) superfamily
MSKAIKKATYSTLITDLASLIEQGRKAAVRYVNTALVTTYWLIGRRIVEYEQKGKERAEYGEVLLERLAKDLTSKFGKGFGRENLRLMRQFFLTYQETQISQTVSGKLSIERKGQTLSDELVAKPQTASGKSKKCDTLCSESQSKQKGYPLFIQSEISHTLSAKFTLSWSHYCLLMRLDEPFKREFYESECIKGNWSVRQLDIHPEVYDFGMGHSAISGQKSAKAVVIIGFFTEN